MPLFQGVIVMCNAACLEFGRTNIREEEVRGKTVIEVGALDINGSLRQIVEALRPKSYVGVDIQKGPGVDYICDAHSLLNHFAKETGDLLISTELFEHVRDWRVVVSNFKNILKPGGIVLITTRSRGFPFHGYPCDYWRYELSDMQAIWSDFIIESIESDPLAPGVFLKARKPKTFTENDLTRYTLYSPIKNKLTLTITAADIDKFRLCYMPRLFLSGIATAFSLITKKLFGR